VSEVGMVRNRKEAWAGVVFMAFAAFILVQVHDYDMGTPTQMGPGFFPTMLAVLLAVLGAVTTWRGVRSSLAAPVGTLPLMPLAFVSVGALAFAALIGRHGLAAAIVAMLALSCYGRLRQRPLEVAVLCVSLVAVAYVIFILVIQLPVDIW
jgi:hypothetical protein